MTASSGSHDAGGGRAASAVARIAHRAGNDRLCLQRAIEARVDWIEIDLWYAFGKLIARHERSVWRLPILYDKWHFKLVRQRLLDLDELIDATRGGPRLFIDLKGTHPRLPAAIVQTLRKHDAVERAAVCGQFWPPLDQIGRTERRLQIYHSLGRPEHVVAHLERSGRGLHSSGVSIAHWLVTPELVGKLKSGANQVFAWTVNDPGHASQLVAWGVDGIISDRIDLLAGLP